MMEQIIRTLIGHIQSSMPQLALVDEDYGQLEYIDKEDVDTYPLVMPAVLIDTPETSWTDTADGGQKGTCKVRVRLIIDCYDDTHATSGTSDRVAERERMRHWLHRLLQGFRPDSDGALVRTQSRFYTWSYGIKVYEQTYTTTTSETVADPPAVATARPVVRFRTVR